MSIRRYMQWGAVAAGGVMCASAAHAQAVFTRANVAEGKTAAQISTGFGRGPQQAVDGNLGEAGTHTTGSDAPPLWWEVDLSETFAIDSIDIFNRDDCCADRLRDFEVMILDENRVEVWNSGETNSGGVNGGASIDYFFDFANDEFRTEIGGVTQTSETIDFGASTFAGRFVRVEKNTGGVLTLNEVRAWALTDILARPVMEINRETGAMSIRNNTGSALQIIGYTITSDAGALDASNWRSLTDNPDAQGLLVENTGDWFKFSAPGSNTDLSEGSLQEVFIDHLGRLDLTATNGDAPGDGIWIQNPNEDVEVLMKLADGSDVVALVDFVGNDGNPFAIGDLDFDGDVDADDWDVFRGGLLGDLSGLSQAQAYQAGDLNGDGNSDILDFSVFKDAYEAAQGQGAFAALVPEPASLTLLAMGIAGLARRRRA